ncbi:SusD domain containing protein [Flavobacteriaceae bacterium]
MKTIKFILFTIFAAFIISCDSQLELDPKQNEDGSTTLTTEKGITDVLTGTYAILADTDAYGGSTQISADLLAQTASTTTTEFRWGGTFNTYTQIYRKSILVDNTKVRDIWASNYEIINATNVVIENIGLVQDPNKAKVMIAEAKFLQSLAYFDLVRFFAKPYDATLSANSQLGVVIRPKAFYDYTNTDLAQERSSVDEVYQLVINGLEQAYTDLPADNGFYANKYAAKALLARVYLQQQNYPAALNAAQDVIANSGAKLSATYKDAFNHDSNQVEDIFAIQITSQTGSNELLTHYGGKSVGGRGGDIAIRTPYLNRFTDPNDERRNFNYVGSSKILTLKYTNQFADVAFIRLAEMLLIRAECNLRLNSLIGATPLDDINTLRTRAKATNFTSLTLNQILNERFLELAMEGFAIHDIKRTKGSVTSSLPWDSDKLVFPIPLRETDNNKKITQNPGY